MAENHLWLKSESDDPMMPLVEAENSVSASVVEDFNFSDTSLNLEMLDNIFGPSENVVIVPENASKTSEAPSITPDLHRFNVGQWNKNDVYGRVLYVERRRDLQFNFRNPQPANDDFIEVNVDYAKQMVGFGPLRLDGAAVFDVSPKAQWERDAEGRISAKIAATTLQRFSVKFKVASTDDRGKKRT